MTAITRHHLRAGRAPEAERTALATAVTGVVGGFALTLSVVCAALMVSFATTTTVGGVGDGYAVLGTFSE